MFGRVKQICNPIRHQFKLAMTKNQHPEVTLASDRSPSTLVACITLALVSTFATEGQTAIKEISKRIVDMPQRTPAQCKANGSCALKGAQLVERKIKVLLPDEPPDQVMVMTDMRFILNFDKPKSIEKFAVVQLMNGCMFETEKKPDGSIEYSFSAAHKNFGQYKLLKYTSPVVDAETDDPVKTAYKGHGRFDLYRWSQDPTTTDPDNDEWYFFGKPTHGTVYTSDLVSYTGLKTDKNPTARNSSLELSTCVFKASDLPKTSDASGTGIDFKKAIWCASWDHKFGYDFNQGEIVAETGLNPNCSL